MSILAVALSPYVESIDTESVVHGIRHIHHHICVTRLLQTRFRDEQTREGRRIVMFISVPRPVVSPMDCHS